MKSYWVDQTKPSPFKVPTINGTIYANIVAAQAHVGRALTRQEIAALIKRMKERGILTSKRNNWTLADNFTRKLKSAKAVLEQKP